jgi:putative ABC transport system permease protein
MSVYDLIHETLLSVTNNKVRSSLTILGIVVGIASVILMVSIGQGSQASITASISSAGANLLTVSPGGGRFGGFGGGGGRGGESSTPLALTQADATLIKAIPGVAAVSPTAQSQYAVSTPGTSVNMRVIGAGDSYDVVNTVNTDSGSFIGAEDIRGGTKVCVLGPTAVTDLFAAGVDPIGQKVRIKGINFTVVGVTKSKGGSSFMNSDEVVYIPITTLQRFLTGNDEFGSITVKASSADVVSSVQTAITAALVASHHVKDPTQPGFSVQSQADILSTASTITGTFTLLLASIAGISLFVGGIGIMNMMLTTVTERTREIGLRKAIGARPRDITSQFLAEAITLCLTGGVIGILIGWGGSQLINLTGLMTTLVSSSAVLMAVGVCAGIGVVFGYYPARRAAKLDPIEALRYQ